MLTWYWVTARKQCLHLFSHGWFHLRKWTRIWPLQRPYLTFFELLIISSILKFDVVFDLTKVFLYFLNDHLFLIFLLELGREVLQIHLYLVIREIVRFNSNSSVKPCLGRYLWIILSCTLIITFLTMLDTVWPFHLNIDFLIWIQIWIDFCCFVWVL